MRVSFVIDGRDVGTFDGNASSTTRVDIVLPDSTDLFRQFRSGQILSVRAPNGSQDFRLDGTSVGLQGLLNCVQRHNGGTNAATPSTPSRQPLFGSAPSSPSRPLPDGDAATLSEAFRVYANIASGPGFSEVTVIDPKDAPALLRGSHVVWRGSGHTGAVRVSATVRPSDYDSTVAAVIAEMAKVCKGAFASGSVREDRASIRRVSTTCVTGGLNERLAVWLVPRPDGGTYVLSFLADDSLPDPRPATRAEVEGTLRAAAFRIGEVRR